MSQNARVLVTGAGGFIGHHLTTYLKKQGSWVRGVDIKYPEYARIDADEFELLDLRRWDNCLEATRGIQEVYALAADMGGMGFISEHHAQILHNNALISIHTLEAARVNSVKRYFYTSISIHRALISWTITRCISTEFHGTMIDLLSG